MNLQMMGASRLQYKPWPAFLHLKRGRDISPLVPVMVGDNPTSMGPRVPAVTRVARTERTAAGEWGKEALVTGLPLPAGGGSWSLVPTQGQVPAQDDVDMHNKWDITVGGKG